VILLQQISLTRNKSVQLFPSNLRYIDIDVAIDFHLFFHPPNHVLFDILASIDESFIRRAPDGKYNSFIEGNELH